MGKSCFDCIHKSVCDAYESRGLTDFENGDVKICKLFMDRTRCLILPCAVGGTVYRLTKRDENGVLMKKKFWKVTKVIISSEIEALKIKKRWNKTYFSSPWEAELSIFKR